MGDAPRQDWPVLLARRREDERRRLVPTEIGKDHGATDQGHGSRRQGQHVGPVSFRPRSIDQPGSGPEVEFVALHADNLAAPLPKKKQLDRDPHTLPDAD